MLSFYRFRLCIVGGCIESMRTDLRVSLFKSLQCCVEIEKDFEYSNIKSKRLPSSNRLI
jgi:hypothetical protein